MEARNGVNQAVVVTGLFLFCLAALLVPAFVMDWRLSRQPGAEHPLTRVERSQPGPVGTVGRVSGPGPLIVEGVRTSLARAVLALLDHRTDAMESLESARRVARAASTGFEGEWGATFSQILQDIEVSRRDVQNGSILAARPHLQAAIRLLDALARTPADPSRLPRASGLTPGYAGATLVDADGRVVGEVAAIDWAAEEVEVRLGGWPDILGLIDLGGRTARVAASDLVYGEPSRIRETIVVAPF